MELGLKQRVEILQDRLYYVALRSAPTQALRRMHHFFCIDNELVYWNFFLDFGPLSLGQLYRFCQGLNTKLRDASLRDKVIYFYSGVHPHRRANASLLITAWTVLYLHRTPEEALLPFRYIIQSLPAFHDASPCVCTYQLRVIDCLRGLEKARRHRFFDFENFNLLSYEHYEQVEHGDLNWIVEGKFLAFAGPCERSSITPEGYRTLTPDDFIPYFKKHNVTLVIRLNKKYYDETKFTRAGIAHAELYYLDGSVPSHSILSRFLELCERTPGAVAVHCKAGLGRTGTCIGCYLMKHYHMTAAEAIGWMRVCRPGSVIGPQQHFMQDMEQLLWQERTGASGGLALAHDDAEDTRLSTAGATTPARHSLYSASTSTGPVPYVGRRSAGDVSPSVQRARRASHQETTTVHPPHTPQLQLRSLLTSSHNRGPRSSGSFNSGSPTASGMPMQQQQHRLSFGAHQSVATAQPPAGSYHARVSVDGLSLKRATAASDGRGIQRPAMKAGPTQGDLLRLRRYAAATGTGTSNGTSRARATRGGEKGNC